MPTEETKPVRDLVAVQCRAVLVLALTQVVGGIGMGAMLAVGALIALELSGSDTWSGMATTMITLGAAVFALAVRVLIARRRWDGDDPNTA